MANYKEKKKTINAIQFNLNIATIKDFLGLNFNVYEGSGVSSIAILSINSGSVKVVYPTNWIILGGDIVTVMTNNDFSAIYEGDSK